MFMFSFCSLQINSLCDYGRCIQPIGKTALDAGADDDDEEEEEDDDDGGMDDDEEAEDEELEEDEDGDLDLEGAFGDDLDNGMMNFQPGDQDMGSD